MTAPKTRTLVIAFKDGICADQLTQARELFEAALPTVNVVLMTGVEHMVTFEHEPYEAAKP